VPGTLELAEQLAPLLRAGDVAEGLALGLDPRQGLLDSVRCSEVSWAALFDGEVGAMVGARTTARTLLGTAGEVWILSGTAVDRNPRAFMRSSRQVLEQLLQQWDSLSNVVDTRYEASLRWLKWLGFSFAPPVPMGPQGVLFCRCTIRR
jgi:hypothetical protein